MEELKKEQQEQALKTKSHIAADNEKAKSSNAEFKKQAQEEASDVDSKSSSEQYGHLSHVSGAVI